MVCDKPRDNGKGRFGPFYRGISTRKTLIGSAHFDAMLKRFSTSAGADSRGQCNNTSRQDFSPLAHLFLMLKQSLSFRTPKARASTSFSDMCQNPRQTALPSSFLPAECGHNT